MAKKTGQKNRSRKIMIFTLIGLIITGTLAGAGCSLFPSDMVPTLPSLTESTTTSGSEIVESPLLITEVMTSNQTTLQTADLGTPDWIEIHNAGTAAINLKDYCLSDNIKKPTAWRFPAAIIQPGAYLLVYASGLDPTDASTQAGEIHANFRLNSTGDELVFTNPSGQILARLTIPALPTDISYGLLDTAASASAPYYFFGEPTPGRANGLDGKTTAAEAIPHPKYDLVVNEYMTDNRTWTDLDGDLPDWVEFCNTGSTEISLLGFTLSDDAGNLKKWTFPDVKLAPGAYLLVWLSGKDRAYDPAALLSLHASFRLGSQDTELILSDPKGNQVIRQPIASLPPNVSYGRQNGSPDNWLYFPLATPGQANMTGGFADISGAITLSARGIWINEVMAYSATFSASGKTKAADWVELYNGTSQTVNLSGYGLSDSMGNLYRMKLPDKAIAPGQYLALDLDGFGLSADGETLYLTDPHKSVVDWFTSGWLSNGTSCGRGDKNGNEPADTRFFYSQPTRGAANSTASFNGTAEIPVIMAISSSDNQPAANLYPQGPVNIVLSSPQTGVTIRYTLDGSEPNSQSAIYTEPIRADRTTVISCRAFASGYLPSRTVSRTYLFGVRHDLPVVSMTLDPADFTGSNGFWTNYSVRNEYPARVSYYQQDGTLGVTFATGVALHGAYSRSELQKSLELNLRQCYGDAQVIYPFFPGNPVSTFKRLILRTSGQDWKYTKLRDAFMSEVVQGQLEVDTMDWQPCVLYINGEYYGLYEVRESIDNYYVEAHFGTDPDNVDIIKYNNKVMSGSYDAYKELLTFVKTHDLKIEENYQYVLSRIDEKSLMDWVIAETFFNNLDSGNKKFWCERKAGAQWRWAFFDLDWAMFPSTYTINILANDLLDPNGHGQQNLFSSAMQVKLMENPKFKEAFIERYAELINTTFATDRMLGILDSMTEQIQSEMPRQIGRWGLPSSVAVWQNNVATLRRITGEKRGRMQLILQSTFNISAQRMHELFPGDF